MRVGIQTWGTEGDLRPFFALADGLERAGHQATVMYSSVEDRDYSPRLENARFAHRKVGSSPMAADELTRAAREVFADPNGMRQLHRILELFFDPIAGAMMEAALELAANNDVIVQHTLVQPAVIAAEKANKPFVSLLTAPMLPTKTMPPPGAPSLGSFANGLLWKLGVSMIGKKLMKHVEPLRAAQGLPKIKRVEDQMERAVLGILAVSPALFERPADYPENVVVTGFLNGQPPAAWDPPKGLDNFMSRGRPPIFVTFGSMLALDKDPLEVVRMIYRATELSGCRTILQTELTGDELPKSDKVYRIGFAPHDLIFPRCAAIVHHGGAGTTQSAMRSGKPSIVVAHITDQFFWGQLLHRHGVAPKHLIRRKLRPEALADLIRETVANLEMSQRAERLGARMRDEDGVSEAVRAIERVTPR